MPGLPINVSTAQGLHTIEEGLVEDLGRCGVFSWYLPRMFLYLAGFS